MFATISRSPWMGMSPRVRLALRAALAVILACLWLVLALAIVGFFYTPNTQLPDDLPGTHVVAAGIPLRVLQNGQGRDVLLIHGSPGSIEDWTPLMRALSRSFRVTAYDRPGHGWSGDNGAYSPGDNAQVALALMERLNLRDVIVVGHSYGGAIALALALYAPPRASAYVILDTAAYAPLRKVGALQHVLGWPVLGVGTASVIGTFVAPIVIRKALEDAFGRRAPSEDFVALRTRIWSTPKVLHATALETLSAQTALPAQSRRYAEIRQPVAIVGQADDAQRRATAQRLHANIAGSTLMLLSGTGHYVQFEKTRDVADAIRQIAEVSSATDEDTGESPQ
jgi:pimeloyl-ACP methyl ester carboxylesterase